MKALTGMVRWRCIRCAASGVGVTLDDATNRLIEHNKKVHPEEGEA